MILALICVVTIVAMTATGTSIDGILDTITGVLGGDLVPDAPGGGAGGTMSAALAEAITFADGDSSFVKGHNVTINGAEYKVLKVDGNNVTLMGVTDLDWVAYSANDTITFSNGSSYAKYDDSYLDSEMTTFFNGLPEAVQNAIVEKNITQKVYRYDDYGSGGTQVASATHSDGSSYQIYELGSVAVGSRKVWAPGVEDIIDYLGDSWTAADLMNMFFDSPPAYWADAWLSSASCDFGEPWSAVVVNCYGSMGCNSTDENAVFRPAFIINIA